jgi:beta-phosphoglucomutase-like phosphatase (HAD superfamily)
VFEFALRRLAIPAGQAIAIEDSVTGARSALFAGLVTIGVVQFVPTDERKQRVEDLTEAGVLTVVHSWPQLAEVLMDRVS